MRVASNKLLVLSKYILATSSMALLAGCGDPAPGEGVEGHVGEPPMPRVASASEAIQTANISAIDPATMQEAEIDKVIPPGPRCNFAYTAESPPILGASMARNGEAIGVIKIHGRLVQVKAAQVASFEGLINGGTFRAGDVTLEVRAKEVRAKEPEGSQRPAEAHFSIADELTVGYRGWYKCTQEG